MKARRIILSLLFLVMSGAALAGTPTDSKAIRHLWGDFNNDGLEDLFVLDEAGNKLFQNAGNGAFNDVTNQVFLQGAKIGLSGIWGDDDQDGWPDLYLFHSKGFTLFRNDGLGMFVDVTKESGLDPNLLGSAIHLKDYDKDGHADLVLETPKGDKIYHNLGNGSFEELLLPGVGGKGKIGGSILLGKDGSATPGDAPDNSSKPDKGDSKVKGTLPSASNGRTGLGQVGKRMGNKAPPGGSGSKTPNPSSSLPPFGRDYDWDYWTNAPHMFAIPSGNVGIGTTEPESKLHIHTTGATDAHGRFAATGSGSAGIYFDASNGDFQGSDYGSLAQGDDLAVRLSNYGNNPISLRTYGQDRVTIAGSGNVGIGTTSPNAELEVRGQTSPSIRIASNDGGEPSLQLFEMGGGGGTTPYGFEFLLDGSDDKLHLWSRTFAGNEAIRMTWYKNGNVGVGATSPSERLDLQDGSGDGTLRLGNTSSSNTGTIRWSGSDFEGYNGSAWQSFTGGGGSTFPQGGIIMWSGDVASIPSGWALCDGTSGTPDLSNKFIRSGDNPGTTGGADSYSLTVAQMPSHTHTFTTDQDGSHFHHIDDVLSYGSHWGDKNMSPQFANNAPGADTDVDGAHSHSGTTDEEGSGELIDNRPAYFTLAFIIKL